LIRKDSVNSALLFVADHPALDFLNTRIRVDQDMVDVLQADRDVLAWLRQSGLPIPTIVPKIVESSLLRCARKLREEIRSLVESRKAGKRGDPSVLNRFLAASQSYPQLLWNKPGSLTIGQVRPQNTPESILGPLAEAAADLLANGDFELVKHCEGVNCVLWFYDLTKSHHRRWCSMELCGNRFKVAAYRERRRDRSASHGQRR
jgi:predicted RNA-binding Zn ribbon-like protein